MARSSRSKSRKSRRKKASWSCCPIIRINCRMVGSRFAYRKRSLVSDGNVYTARIRTALPPTKKCTVMLGKQVVLKDAPSDRVGKKVAKLKKSLNARRCMAVVQSKGVKS